MSATEFLDAAIPVGVVLVAATDLLDSANWTLEFADGELKTIPKSPEPVVATRSFVKAHAPDTFLGDHFEAVVYLAPERCAENWIATAGILKLYFDIDGNFVSEDRCGPMR